MLSLIVMNAFLLWKSECSVTEQCKLRVNLFSLKVSALKKVTCWDNKNVFKFNYASGLDIMMLFIALNFSPELAAQICFISCQMFWVTPCFKIEVISGFLASCHSYRENKSCPVFSFDKTKKNMLEVTCTNISLISTGTCMQMNLV